jgi:D-alanyl-D-alanine dipeptidase
VKRRVAQSLVALLAACHGGLEPTPQAPTPGDTGAPSRPSDAGGRRTNEPSRGAAPSAGPGDAAGTSDATGASVIPATARQLVTGIIADWSSTAVTLRRWRWRGGAWTADGDAWQGVIGQTGAAWGSGLHGDGAPGGHDGPCKHEGDGKSPAGAFEVRGVYGYAAAPPPATVLPYTQVTADWQCVDDPASHHYTQIVDRSRTLPIDWTSAEEMRRRDELYTWVIDIAHNRSAAPGAGSCIFFHVWRGPASSTAGCTAMPEPTLARLIGGLDATAVYVLLPRAEYDAFAAPWGLPAAGK